MKKILITEASSCAGTSFEKRMCNNMPLISVIMPAYNSAEYITEAINSVLAQTYTNWELIVIDDGSSDDTVKIVCQFEAADKRICLLKNTENVGVSISRNRGIAAARGEWIAFLDSDDIWSPSKLAQQANYILKTNCNFIFTASSFITESGEKLSWIMEVPDKVGYKRLLKRNVISCSSVLIKKRLIHNIGMSDDRTHEDFALWLKILRQGSIAYGINEPLLIYRLSGKSKSGNKLKSIVMSYRTYRSIGLNKISSIYYLCFLIINGIKKYTHLLKHNGVYK